MAFSRKTFSKQIRRIAAAAIGVVTSLPLMLLGDQSLTLRWDPALWSGVAGYKVDYGTASGSYTRSTRIGRVTQVTIPGLMEGQTYHFVVRAFDAAGAVSKPSNEVAVTIPLPPSGTYSGLFAEPDEVRPGSAGSFSLTLTSRSTYSGRLQVGGSRYSFSGKLDRYFRGATKVMRRGAVNPFRLELEANQGEDSISGLLLDGQWAAMLSGDRAVFNSKTSPSQFAGNYTVIIAGGTGDPAVPEGHAYGVVKVAPGGAISFVGTLPDNTKISQGATLSRGGWWPLFASPYSGTGVVLGWLSFACPAGFDLNGAVSWIRPPNPALPLYPSGITNRTEAFGSRYVPPAGSLLGGSNVEIYFLGGNLAADFGNVAALGSKGKLINQSSNPLTIKYSPANGLFSGKVLDPSSGKEFPFGGVILQQFNAGYGSLSGTSQCSEVLMVPPLELSLTP